MNAAIQFKQVIVVGYHLHDCLGTSGEIRRSRQLAPAEEISVGFQHQVYHPLGRFRSDHPELDGCPLDHPVRNRQNLDRWHRTPVNIIVQDRHGCRYAPALRHPVPGSRFQRPGDCAVHLLDLVVHREISKGKPGSSRVDPARHLILRFPKHVAGNLRRRLNVDRFIHCPRIIHPDHSPFAFGDRLPFRIKPDIGETTVIFKPWIVVLHHNHTFNASSSQSIRSVQGVTLTPNHMRKHSSAPLECGVVHRRN